MKKKVMIYPSIKKAENRYLNNLYKTLKDSYDVTGYDEAKAKINIFNYDIYHFNWIEGNNKNRYLPIKIDYLKKSIFIKILKILNKKIVWTVHNNIPHETKNKKEVIKFMKFMAKNSDRIHILCKETSKNKYLKDYNDKIVYIPHGDYIGNYDGEDIDIRKKYDIPKNKKIMLFVGQIRKYKNIELLMKAFKNSKLEENEYILLICGNCNDKSYKEDLIKISNNNSIYFDFNFIKDNEMKSYLKNADIVIAPYNKKSSLNSGTLWMSMSYSKTMVLPLIGCVKDINNYKDFLYVYDYNDEKEHYNALLNCLLKIKEEITNNPIVLKEKGKKAYEYIKSNQSWKSLKNKWIELYKF